MRSGGEQLADALANPDWPADPSQPAKHQVRRGRRTHPAAPSTTRVSKFWPFRGKTVSCINLINNILFARVKNETWQLNTNRTVLWHISISHIWSKETEHFASPKHGSENKVWQGRIFFVEYIRIHPIMWYNSFITFPNWVFREHYPLCLTVKVQSKNFIYISKRELEGRGCSAFCGGRPGPLCIQRTPRTCNAPWIHSAQGRRLVSCYPCFHLNASPART